MLIDEEFKSLIHPLSEEEYKGLEESILKEGVRDSLVVWDNGNDWILIDGHNRYEIAQKHNLPYNQRRMEFPDRESVKEWIITNQLSRRNINEWQRYDLTKALREIEQAKAKQRQGSRTDITPMLAESEKGETRDKMAEKVGVSHGTYDKMKAIDDSDNDGLKKAVRNGDITINKAYLELKADEQETKVQREKRELKEAEQRHEDFQKPKEQSVIEFTAIRQDKEDLKLLADSFYEEFETLYRQYLKFEIKCSAIEVSERVSNLNEEDRTGFISDIDKWIERLHSLKKKIGGNHDN